MKPLLHLLAYVGVLALVFALAGIAPCAILCAGFLLGRAVR